ADGGDGRRHHRGGSRPDRRRPGVSAHPVGTARRDGRRIRHRRTVHICARAAHTRARAAWVLDPQRQLRVRAAHARQLALAGDRAERSPEEWARAAIEDAAGLAGQFIWRVVLGLRLERRPSLDHVGGWKIGDRDDNWVRLEAASWFLTAQIVVQVDPEQVSVATFIRYDRPMAAVIWPPLSIGHRPAMPGLPPLARERALRPPCI